MQGKKQKLIKEISELISKYNGIIECIKKGVHVNFDELHELDVKKDALMKRIDKL